jgi:hypothetical protein
MARLPEGKQKLGIGCYYTMSPGNGLTINTELVIKWYAWPFLLWKYAHKEYSFRWNQYPIVILNITLLSIKKWLGK